MKTSEVKLFKPRDGYRTRVSPAVLGPVVEYYLPSAPSDAVVIEILDPKGAVLNSYNSETAPPRGGRGNQGAGMPGVAAPVRSRIPMPRPCDGSHRRRESRK